MGWKITVQISSLELLLTHRVLFSKNDGPLFPLILHFAS